MQSKYKVGLLRLNLVLAAVLLALQAPVVEPVAALLLWLATGWLVMSAMLLAPSHRRPTQLPWRLLPSVLLAALLWVAPERHLLWLWAWAVLIMLPQPGWMAALNAVLAILAWWSLLDTLPLEQAALSGLVLAGLMLLGWIRPLGPQTLDSLARRRMRLIPGLRLWPREQLVTDLARERARAQREGVHAELLLLRPPRHHYWALARRLCHLTRRFESCYRLDHRTLAALLLSRDACQADARRQRLLEGLGPLPRLRATPLSRIGSLAEERRALDRQEATVTVDRELVHD